MTSNLSSRNFSKPFGNWIPDFILQDILTSSEKKPSTSCPGEHSESCVVQEESHKDCGFEVDSFSSFQYYND